MAAKKKKSIRQGGWSEYLKKIKPREKIEFHSNYMVIDGRYECILGFFYNTYARVVFNPMWGLQEIPINLPEGVRTVIYEQIHPETQGWIKEHQNRTDRIERQNLKEQNENGTISERQKADKSWDDIVTVNQELNNGASYLHVHKRMLVSAPSLEALEEAIEIIQEYYKNLSVVSLAIYPGCQRQELETLLAKNRLKKGPGTHFTSTEYAGKYSLVNQGFEDPEGVFIGYMTGEVNASAVFFDFNAFHSRAVIMTGRHFWQKRTQSEIYVADQWAAAISQDIRSKGGRVIHILLSNTNLDDITLPYRASTVNIDMQKGELNMFEIFGDQKNPQAAFDQQLEKLRRINRQFCKAPAEDLPFCDTMFQQILIEAYIQAGMWSADAGIAKEKVNVYVPHNQAMRLNNFMLTFAQYRRKAQVEGAYALKNYEYLYSAFVKLQKAHSAIFDCQTSPSIDAAANAQRVIYDFSKLYDEHDQSIAMAQLINVMSYASDSMRPNDCLIIHGAEHIDRSISSFMEQMFRKIEEKNGRIVLAYRDPSACFDAKTFNRFDQADYLIIGAMTPALVGRYMQEMATDLSPNLQSKLSNDKTNFTLVRRQMTNVLLDPQIVLMPSRI